MARTVRLRFDLGTVVTGIWCNACMTSGGFNIPLNRLTEHGVSTTATAAGCTTCRGRGDLSS